MIVFAVPFVGLIVATGNLLWIFAYMSSIIARLVQREGFTDVSFDSAAVGRCSGS